MSLCLASKTYCRKRRRLFDYTQTRLWDSACANGWPASARRNPSAFPQVERGVELDEDHAPRSRAAALRTRFSLPIRVIGGRRRVRCDTAVCALIGVGGYCGPACGQGPTMPDAHPRWLRPRWRLRLPRPCPRSRPPRLLDGFAGNGRRFRHGSGLLCGFLRQLFAVDSADLGKRRRCTAFRAGSACETAQKLQARLACVGGGASNVCFGFIGAGRRRCDHLSSRAKLADCAGRHVGAPLPIGVIRRLSD